MKKTLFTILLACGAALSSVAQTTPYTGRVAVAFPQQAVEGDRVTLRAVVDFTELDLHRNQLLELTPVLRSTAGTREQRFEPLVISGRQRARLVARAEKFGNYAWTAQPSEIILLNDKAVRSYEIVLSVPFEKWMRTSQLVVEERTLGCRNDDLAYADGKYTKLYTGNPYAFPAPYQPAFTVSYLVPEAEPVKIMQDTYTAALQFPVNRTDLQRGFGNNARVLDEVDEIIDRVKNDPLLTVRNITVKGYASPEGNSAANQRLSEGRAQAFVSYLQGRHGYRPNDRMITAQGMGEDWAGLRTAVENASYFEGRQQVLDAIDQIADPARRKTTIRAIDGGRTYRTLLSDLYPALRRNEYTVQYEVRGFNAQDAKGLVWTRPHLLGLNEFYLVAQLYDPASREFKEVFDIAARMYPDSEVAQFNTGAMEVENGSYDTAIARLEKIDTPEAWNNLGVAYWKKGDYEKATSLFNKAAGAGLEDARINQEQYRRWFDDKEE